MTPIYVTFQVANEPALNDPINVAEDIETIYNEWASANGQPTIRLVTASWDEEGD